MDLDFADQTKEGQIQLQVEYGSQHGQLQVTVMEINSLILPTVKRLGISHVYVKSHLLNEKTLEPFKKRSTFNSFFLQDTSKETKRKTEDVKLTMSTSDSPSQNNNENSRKSRIRKALKKQRERFRFRRNSDRVKTVVNAAGNENGRATLSFERSLYYPSVSLYQLQTQCLHLTICGRNATTTQSFPIATTCIPLMIAIKQHQPTWYQISYNPDLAMDNEGSKMISVQQTWDRNEEGAFTGRNVAWDRSNNNHSYSRHLQSNRKQSIAKKSTIHVNIPGQDGLRRPKRS
ncbi:uncharacterized protein LOC124444986 [Xenia sp. Carnegie-2017]|uniref:uncharacterized protein LOC124444986 n=1 Tax=Xenia sp. Carnegie-2017 TaxID=2897299 RepID=UPI001F04A40F|nr:uncharacterized protein LOC124444986 [Xenia sp. Carnegie-2017]